MTFCAQTATWNISGVISQIIRSRIAKARGGTAQTGEVRRKTDSPLSTESAVSSNISQITTLVHKHYKPAQISIATERKPCSFAVAAAGSKSTNASAHRLWKYFHIYQLTWTHKKEKAVHRQQCVVKNRDGFPLLLPWAVSSYSFLTLKIFQMTSE